MPLGEVDSFEFEERGQAEGPAINVKYKDSDSFTEENEFYQLPGIASGPTKGDRVVILPIEGGYRVIIAAHNYKVGVDVQPGGTKIYSTNESGTTKQAEIHLKPDGEIEHTTMEKVKFTDCDSIEFMGSSKKLVTHAELNTALQTFVTALNLALGTKLDGGGTPGTLTLDISASEATKLKTS